MPPKRIVSCLILREGFPLLIFLLLRKQAKMKVLIVNQHWNGVKEVNFIARVGDTVCIPFNNQENVITQKTVIIGGVKP